MNTRETVGKIVQLLDEKKGYNISVYHIGEESSIAEYMVLCNGNSDTHLNSLADYVITELKKDDVRPFAMDGYRSSRWVCVDYGDILVNLLGDEERDFYNLEAIWGGSPRLDVHEFVKNPETTPGFQY